MIESVENKKGNPTRLEFHSALKKVCRRIAKPKPSLKPSILSAQTRGI